MKILKLLLPLIFGRIELPLTWRSGPANARKDSKFLFFTYFYYCIFTHRTKTLQKQDQGCRVALCAYAVLGKVRPPTLHLRTLSSLRKMYVSHTPPLRGETTERILILLVLLTIVKAYYSKNFYHLKNL